MANSLRMSFLTDGDKKVILSVPYAAVGIDGADVRTSMEAIMAAQIFTFNLISIDGAEIVQTVKTDLI